MGVYRQQPGGSQTRLRNQMDRLVRLQHVSLIYEDELREGHCELALIARPHGFLVEPKDGPIESTLWKSKIRTRAKTFFNEIIQPSRCRLT